MSDHSPLTPLVLPGALIVLKDTPVVPLPSFIVFQYNPATLNRSISPHRPSATPGEESGPTSRSQPGPPTETISLKLELDATDFFEDPGNHPVGSTFGVASPVASMEKLMYPTGSVVDGLISAVTNLLGLGGAGSAVPRSEVPVVLFFWGPSRILPVRVTSLVLDEQAHTPTLYPTMVAAQMTLEVLPPDTFRGDGVTSMAEQLAIASYEWTALHRDTISAAGLIDTVAGWIPDG